MYNAQTVRDRIKERQRANGIKNLDAFLVDIGISPSSIYNMSDTRGMTCFKLAAIADALNTSVDYLLGRSDTAELSLSVNNSHATITAPQTNVNVYENITPDEREILTMISRLSLIQRSELVLLLQKMIRGEQI